MDTLTEILGHMEQRVKTNGVADTHFASLTMEAVQAIRERLVTLEQSVQKIPAIERDIAWRRDQIASLQYTINEIGNAVKVIEERLSKLAT